VIRCQRAIIGPDDLPPELLEFHVETAPGTATQELGADEIDRVKAALKWARGNRTRAATLLGVSRATLYRRLKELGLDDA